MKKSISIDQQILTERIQIAQLHGYTNIKESGPFRALIGNYKYPINELEIVYIPKYHDDLNAIQKVIDFLTEKHGDWFWAVFKSNLERVNPDNYWNATATERCKALLMINFGHEEY